MKPLKEPILLTLTARKWEKKGKPESKMLRHRNETTTVDPIQLLPISEGLFPTRRAHVTSPSRPLRP